MDGDNNNNSDDKPSFNIGVHHTTKIAYWLDVAESNWYGGKFNQSTWALKVVFHKINSYLNDKESKKIEKDFLEIEKLLAKRTKGYEISSKVEKMILYLGRMMNDIGLLIPVSSDPRFMFK